jgi:hypothetical protein
MRKELTGAGAMLRKFRDRVAPPVDRVGRGWTASSLELLASRMARGSWLIASSSC